MVFLIIVGRGLSPRKQGEPEAVAPEAISTVKNWALEMPGHTPQLGPGGKRFVWINHLSTFLGTKMHVFSVCIDDKVRMFWNLEN